MHIQAQSCPTVWKDLVWDKQRYRTLISRLGDSLPERLIQVKIDLWECKDAICENKQLETVSF